MPRGRRSERHSRSPRAVSGTRVKRAHKKEKQQEKEKELRRFEKEKQRAESGKKGSMRAFTASQSDSNADAMSDDEPQDLGAAAPAEKGHDKYLEEQRQKREKAKAHAKDGEEKRKRSEERVQEISEEEEIDLEKYKDYEAWEDMSPEDTRSCYSKAGKSKNSSRTNIGKVKQTQLSQKSSQHRVRHRERLKKQQSSTITNSQDSQETTRRSQKDSS